jgi:hypothetical protein
MFVIDCPRPRPCRAGRALIQQGLIADCFLDLPLGRRDPANDRIAWDRRSVIASLLIELSK